ncbi:MAG: enolase C-terminal domain-like protein [Xanthobacteraceae bacterium]|nr:enolase C-terminal domain-like protein [Xanthobacteraceae bacterium]
MQPPMRSLSVRSERWPIAGHFTISRGAKTEAVVVVAEIHDGPAAGRGECVPYARYGETSAGVIAAIERLGPRIAAGLDRAGLQSALPAGAARNALDCALWDLEAKRLRRRAWEIAGLDPPQPVVTAFTISLAAPAAMAEAARKSGLPILKLKLGAPGDAERLQAVRAAAPAATLIVDANEGWRSGNLAENLSACAAAGVALVEQPLPAGDDAALAAIPRPVPVCADESVHDRATLPRLGGKYDAVNVKLDKAGGLTEALALVEAAARAGFEIMVGSMVATSLGVAPALLLCGRARFVDLDGPLLLARDRPEGLAYQGSRILPGGPELWG